MKYILLLSAAVLFSACGHGHHHGDHADHQHADGHRSCCSAENCSKSDTKGDSNCKMEPKVDANTTEKAISKEALTKLYTVNKKKAGKMCSSAASAYCGKVTRDLNVTQEEFSCLMEKATRVTRESLPALDGSECATMMKNLAKSTVVAPATNQ